MSLARWTRILPFCFVRFVAVKLAERTDIAIDGRWRGQWMKVYDDTLIATPRRRFDDRRPHDPIE